MDTFKSFQLASKIIIIALTFISNSDIVAAKDLSLEEGHLKPFGYGRPNHPVEEIDYFPSPEEFFETYVKPQKPVLMKGVVKDTKTVSLWTDEYLSSLNVSDDYLVNAEPFLKQKVYRGMIPISFTNFVKNYTKNEHYMISVLPEFLRQDVSVFCPIQCPWVLDKNIVQYTMWFSGGGTSGTVHTDAADNILCQFRGEKVFTIVDAEKFGHFVPMNAGAYSDMDAERIDFVKYPTMAKVEYLHANLETGDCLFTPYLWVHQVRSQGSNIAISIWFRHHISEALDYSACKTPCDPTLTFDKVQMHGYGALADNPGEVRDQFLRYLKPNGPFDVKHFQLKLLGESNLRFRDKLNVDKDAKEIFAILDADEDGKVTADEINAVSLKVYSEIAEIVEVLEEDIDFLIGMERAKQVKQEKSVKHEATNIEGTRHTEL